MKIKFKYHSFNRAVELDENIKSLVKKYNFNEADLNKYLYFSRFASNKRVTC